MTENLMDLDLLAEHLSSKIEHLDISVREAAKRIGCSVATLSRLLRGAKGPTPDSTTLLKATSWLGRSIADFQHGSRPDESSLADVEVHLRALPGLSGRDREALVAMVKAAYDAARAQRRQKKK